MADQTPSDDPLGNRLRAIFAAEHADIERHQVVPDPATNPAPFQKWIRFAMATALIAIAGFVFISNRSNERALEPEVAAQTLNDKMPDDQKPTGTPAVITRSGQPPALLAQPSVTERVPYQTGVNLCGDNYNNQARVVLGPNGKGAPALTAPKAFDGSGIAREVPSGFVVDLVGGCTAADTSIGPREWYEIQGVAGKPTEWIRSDYLLTQLGPNLPGANECGVPVPLVAHFVWNISASDPDGGLVAHVAAGVDEPITRIIGIGGVAIPTRGCVLTTNGSAWYEIFAPDGSFDWVNARYLQITVQACIVGEQFGSPPQGAAIANEPFSHIVVPGDALRSIAERYNVTIDVLNRANPELNGGPLIAGALIRIPGAATMTREPPTGKHLIGPINGRAVVDGSRVAFISSPDTARLDPIVSISDMFYQWYPANGVVIGAPCFQEEQLRGPVCLAGEIRVLNLQQPEPIWTGTGPLTAWRTGRIIAPPQAPGENELIEISILTEQHAQLTGVFDSSDDFTNEHCLLTGSDLLADQPCTRVAGAGPTAGLGTNEINRSWAAGNSASGADHVHDIRTESNNDCTRIVIEFGKGANQAESRASVLPAVVVDQQLDSVRITADGWQLHSAFDDPDRIEYEGGIGLFTLTFSYEFAVELMHQEMEPHVRFLNNPARVVIDLFPTGGADQTATGPFGEQFVLRGPIQQDLSARGIPVNNKVVVAGFGRPFEAAGLYRIWAVADDVDLNAFLANPHAPIIEEFFATSGWAEAWGTFFVDLPDLEPGTYVAVFGELPPADELGFYGTGQLFRIVDALTEGYGSWPKAVLLPNVQLPPEPFG